MINFEVSCGVLNGGSDPYEHPSLPKEGKVGITEMWAHAVGYIMLYEYTGVTITNKLYPELGWYWFEPEIMWELYKVGMSLQDINQSMTDGVVTMQSFKEQLISDNPTYDSQISSIFN